MKLIEIIHEKCVGCRLCEMVCSLSHEGECSSAKSRIKIVRDEEFGNNLVSMCLQCVDAPCIERCSYEVISRDEKTGVVQIDEKMCTACGECVDACPVNAISLSSDNGTAFKCDLCSGDPECVKVCSRAAITLKEIDPDAPERKSFRAETGSLIENSLSIGK